MSNCELEIIKKAGFIALVLDRDIPFLSYHCIGAFATSEIFLVQLGVVPEETSTDVPILKLSLGDVVVSFFNTPVYASISHADNQLLFPKLHLT